MTDNSKRTLGVITSIRNPPAAKKARREDANMDESDDEEEDLFASDTAAQPKEVRRDGLSKFVQRMLDPNRKPRGLIEPPQVIPLNDEFLQAFGQREKEFDSKIGRSSEFDQKIEDDDDDDAKINASVAQQAQEKQQQTDTNSRKVKITNLKFTTSLETLREECLNFGPIEEINLLMDENDPTRNKGRAYVVFQTEQAAKDCVEQELGGALDGRTPYVSLVAAASSSSTQTANKYDEPRYWQKDISKKCRRCGEPGHFEADCPNAAKANVCPLCAKPNEHEVRLCPLNRVCFKCGIPGHINRECTVQGNLPPRQICTLCCGSGHNRFQCQRSPTSMPLGIQDAICLVCGERGHFMCKELKWFFGLEGVFCYNCGGKGHVGMQCNRPTLDDLHRNEGWTIKEVERGQEYKLAEEMELERLEREKQEREKERKRQEERDRQRNRYRERDRARSAPPQRPGNDYYDDFTGGYNQYRAGAGTEYTYTVGGDDTNNSGNRNNNRGYRNANNSNNNNNNNNRRGSGARRRGYR